ncbi:hypothetical protein L9F63_008474, partial [Diploptera punctata]
MQVHKRRPISHKDFDIAGLADIRKHLIQLYMNGMQSNTGNASTSDTGFTKIKDHVSGQHKNLLSLRQQHELLDQEIQDRITNLNKIRLTQIALEGDMQTCSIRIKKKEEEMLNMDVDSLSNALKEVEIINTAIEKEKPEQCKILQTYEDAMKDIG